VERKLWKQESELNQESCCPTCNRWLIGDYYRGEIICPSCGFVKSEQTEDAGPEWKALDPDDKEKRVRVGSPRTMMLHDYGLSTEIGCNMKDSQGRNLDGQARNQYYKLKKWQRRVRTTPSERSLSSVLVKITEVSSILNLPKNVMETAAQIYRDSARLKVSRSKSIIGMTAAAVYLACRKCSVGRSLKEIAEASCVDKRTVAKYYRLVLNEVETEYIPPPSIWKYISKLVNTARIDPKVERLALHLARKTYDSKISSGKAPAGLAAAYVYMSSVILSFHTPQREIADVADVTEVTIRNRCREIMELFTISQSLRSKTAQKRNIL
jgi:transcription initiation factor TFIIB